MKKEKVIKAFLVCALCLGLSASLNAQTVLDIETGTVSTGYNDVRIPGEGGTLISFKDNLKPDSKLFYRIRLSYTFGSVHTLSLLYAPLTIEAEGSINNAVIFAGNVFPANRNLSGSYKFNSYRLTYRYDFVKNPGLEFGLGFTAKIRDARIAITSNGVTSEKVNVGFVPILNLRLAWNPHEKLGFLLDGDGLAAPQGRAFDFILAASYKASNSISFKAGYRFLEGGADNDEVYSFALFHYITIGASITF